MTDPLLINWQKKSGDRKKLYTRVLNRAHKTKTLQLLHALHDEAFSKIDCLSCAACCKNYSPRFTGPDIRRASKAIGIKEGAFKEKYLTVDADGDFVVTTAPCPFLGDDNFCSIYEHRPTDCRRFPYTDEDVLLKRPLITEKNATFCPAVYFVLEKLVAINL